MTQHTNPAVTKANPPSGGSSSGAGTDVRAGSAEEEEVRDEQKVAPNHLQKKKNKNHVPLVKASTKKKAGEKPEEEEEGDMMENKKKDAAKKDGCGCPHKKKKKMDGLTKANMDACWKNYEQRGTKMKGGKQVPNCVPKGQSKKKDAEVGRADLKCGKGAISKGEKCTKGQASAAKKGGLGSRFGGGFGGTAKAVGLGALETVKWTSGYNIGKAIAGGENAKKLSGPDKAGKIAMATFAFGPQAGLGAARRSGVFGETDLEADKRYRRRGDSMWASGFKFDGKALHMESQNLAATDTERAKRKKNAQGQPRNKIMAGTRNT